MSTQITVTVGSRALIEKAQEQQAANRAEKLEKERQARITEQLNKAEAEKAAKEQRGDDEEIKPIDRKVAAASSPSVFLPLAVNWKGFLETTTTSYTTELSYQYEIYTNTLSVCTPNPVHLSIDGKKLMKFGQETHISDFSYRVSNLPTNVSDYIGSGHVTSVSYLGPGEGYIPLGPAPILPVNRIAPISFQPGIVVASKGRVLFAAVSMPPEHSVFDNRLGFYPWLNGGQPEITLIDDYPFDIQPSTINLWYGRKTIPYFRPAGQPVPIPYVFLRIQGSNIQSKSAVHRHPQTFGSFYSANAFADDPSKDMRGIHAGEVNVVGSRARFARLKNTETGLYESFPFGNLTTKVSAVTGLPVIEAPHEVVIHTHQLPAYSTPEELALSLSRCVDPSNAGGLYIGPSSEQRWRMPPNFFASAANNLDQSSSDVLTPSSFFLVLS